MKTELSLTTILTIIFVILKLCGVLSWSWWWVLSPLWGGVAIFIVLALIWLFCFIAVTIKEKRENKKKR